MLINNQKRIVLVFVIVFSLLAVYGLFPVKLFKPLAKADSLTSSKDTLSDSGLSASSSHTILFDMTQDLDADDVIQITVHDDFNDLANATAVCPTYTTASTTYTAETFQVVECVATGVVSHAATTTVIYNLTNPGTDGARDVDIVILDEGTTELESTNMKVYILSGITVSASVDGTLTFTVGLLGPDSGTTNVNGVDLTASSTNTTLAFGTLDPTSSTTLGQSLAVITNAQNGFSVTVQQNQDLQSAAGNTINSFNNSPDDTGSSTQPLTAWEKPTGTFGYTNTYGHIGLTSDDGSLDATVWGVVDPFGAAQYAGLNLTDTMQVMYHNGPVDGTGNGAANVAYTVEITDYQESGDYQNTLTYVCTPTY